MKLYRFYIPKDELKRYELEHPNDLWSEVSWILEREKLQAPNGVTIHRSTPYWNPSPVEYNPKAKHHGLYLTFSINK